ncbi:aspartic proteinase NANA, chloroplast-like [Phragmites australis]|uniref:aspartic proteinase NANA, chloroplast-like n=1 Tax=Phragmites australis TaxID=29695 RepID=UPI002D78C4AA|nr:aspartic proteinase NANA, chloroplast-like [Phragmites australis]
MALHGNLLVLLVLLALAAAAVATGGPHQGTSAPLELVTAAPGASLAERARDDRLRHAYISERLARGGDGRRRAAEVGASAFSMPLSSGAYSGTGQYLVRLLVGTPAQQFLLVADTGSDLTWVKCRGPDGASPRGNVFRPADSKSWAPIPCSSDTCKLDVPFSLANCSKPASPCTYDYRYKESSASARGVVGTDSATITLSGGRKSATLQGVVLGCTTSHVGQSFRATDGVISLGNSKISFASRAAARFGGRFSYCLVDHLAPRNATGYLTFGPGPETPRSQTPLLLDPEMPFYGVTVQSILVAGKALAIPGEVWDVKKGGGVILDSGTTLTILATPAYKAVVAELSKHLAGVPKVSFGPFEHCYNWTARRPGAPEIPKLAVQFAGSARFEPPAKSYVIDVKPGVKCIGFQEGEWPGVSVFGNILQQEHLWEFDLKNRMVRFKQTTCTR